MCWGPFWGLLICCHSHLRAKSSFETRDRRASPREDRDDLVLPLGARPRFIICCSDVSFASFSLKLNEEGRKGRVSNDSSKVPGQLGALDHFHQSTVPAWHSGTETYRLHM